MQDSPVIALDVDNTLLDFDSHWRACAEETLQRPITKIASPYSLSGRFGTTSDETKLIWKRFIADHWMATIPAYPTSAKMIADLRELGASLWAVSSVHTSSHEERCESLRGLIPADRVICIGSPDTHPSKAPVLQEIGAQALLDDLPIHVKDAQGVIEYPVLLDQHYDGFDTSDVDYSVQTHAEFVEFWRQIVLSTAALMQQP
jgi:hypothetical protein